MAAPVVPGHDHEVVLGPGEALAIDLGIALALKHEIELRGGVTERRRRLPAPQQLRPVAERREDRAGRHRIDELDLHAFVRIAVVPRHIGERPPDIGSAVEKLRRDVLAADPMNRRDIRRSEETTDERQSLMRISYAVLSLKKKRAVQSTTRTSD